MDLNHAMNEDSVLKEKVNALLQSTTTSSYQEFSNEFKTMMARWSANDNINPYTTRGVQHVQNHNYSKPSNKYVKEVYAYALDVAILEAFVGKEYIVEVDGVMTNEVLGTQASVDMNKAFENLQRTQIVKFLAQVLYKNELSSTDTLFKENLVINLEATLTQTPNDKTALLLVSSMVYNYGINVLGMFDENRLTDDTFKNFLSLNGISYVLNEQGEVSG